MNKILMSVNKIIFCLFFLSILATTVNAQVENYSAGQNGQKLDWLIFYLSQNYVDEVDEDRLTDLAIYRVVQELDPFSQYQTKAELIEQMNADKGYSGKALGCTYYYVQDTAVVTHITAKGPAEKAGLKRGDKLITVNGKNVCGQNYDLLKNIDKDDAINSISLAILRDGNTALNFAIEKDLVPWVSVDAAYMIDELIGYIKIGRFTVNTLDEFVASLNYLKSIGMQQLIIDLRGNTGGVMEQGLKLADQFLSAGKLMNYSEGVNLQRTDHFSTSEGGWQTGKLVILQDVKTASASEIFIAAMQEWDRAVVVGQSTFGKGLIQQSYSLGDSSAVRLTIGKYYTPTGRHLQRYVTESGDFMEPYKEQLYKNALTSSLQLPDNLTLTTKGGRTIVAGPGGIIPDIYYVFDSKEDKTAYNQLNTKGVLYRFATDYTNRNRARMNAEYKTVKSFLGDRIREAFMLKEMREYLGRHAPEISLPKNFPNFWIVNLKSWMASQLWHDNAYYEVDNSNDRTIFRAREIMAGKIHDKLGVSY